MQTEARDLSPLDTAGGRELLAELARKEEARRLQLQRDAFRELIACRLRRERDVPKARQAAEAATRKAADALTQARAVQHEADRAWATANGLSVDVDNAIARHEGALRAAASPLLAAFLSETYELEQRAQRRGVESTEGRVNQLTGVRESGVSNHVGMTQHVEAIRRARRDAEASQLEPLSESEVRARIETWRSSIGDLDQAAILVQMEA